MGYSMNEEALEDYIKDFPNPLQEHLRELWNQENTYEALGNIVKHFRPMGDTSTAINTLEKGDRVKCMDDRGGYVVQKGKEYTVKEISPSGKFIKLDGIDTIHSLPEELFEKMIEPFSWTHKSDTGTPNVNLPEGYSVADTEEKGTQDYYGRITEDQETTYAKYDKEPACDCGIVHVGEGTHYDWCELQKYIERTKVYDK